MKQEHVQKPLINIEDAAVVYKNAKGKVKVQQTLESVVKGSNITSGGLWGLLIGFLFGGPLLGALLGVGLSAIFGRKIDIGIDNDFIKGIGDDLSPGDSALFLLVNNTPIETVADVLKGHGGKLYHTSLSDEMAEAFTEASEHEMLKDAVSAHHDD
ncbi:MAG: DUF1269 domain-containing protein [Ardenticatenaceae bacterium]